MDNRTPYKTAAELGIQQWEHDGLVALIGPLSRGELEFDMTIAHCGTVGCIGGWIAHLADRSPSYICHHDPDTSSPLTPLYFPGLQFADSPEPHVGWKATAPQGARAIINFLVTGDPNWRQVMAAA